jgi:hypothetical protein
MTEIRKDTAERLRENHSLPSPKIRQKFLIAMSPRLSDRINQGLGMKTATDPEKKGMDTRPSAMSARKSL